MKLTFEKFLIAPVKVRILFIKKLLKELGYDIPITIYDDKSYKKALKHFQIKNNFIGNCVITNDLFLMLINDFKNHDIILKNLNRGDKS